MTTGTGTQKNNISEGNVDTMPSLVGSLI